MPDNTTIQSVLDYFGSNSSIYRKIVLGQATDAEISYAFSQIPQMKADISPAGTTLGYSYADPVYIVPSQTDDIIYSINSNGGGSAYGGGVSANYPISIERDSGTGQAFINAGKNGLGDTIKAVADRAALGVVGVNIGCKLGKAIDETLYNLDPEWWNEHYPTINPDTWTSLCGENETGKKFFRTLFNIDDNGNVTGYVDERVLAQTYQLLRDLGVWNTGDKTATIEDTSSLTQLTESNLPLTIVSGGLYLSPNNRRSLNTNCEYVIGIRGSDGFRSYGVSRTPFDWSYSGGGGSGSNINATHNGTTFYGQVTPSTPLSYEPYAIGVPYNQLSFSPNVDQLLKDIGTIIFDGTVTTEGGVDGITDISGATDFPPTNITGTTLDDVLQQLKTNYPNLFTDSITENVVQSDGTVTPHTYVPIPWEISDPTDKTQTSPVTQTNPTTDTTINPDIAPQIITQTEPSSLDDTTTPPPPDTPDTGTGTTDPVITPTGQASSLWAIYNPTQAQLDSFGGWLWSSNFVEQLKKLFNDPMQAIIGVHKVFATPQTGAAQSIVCGYLDSGVSSKIVTSQYSNVDCGSVDLREYFGNVFDYPPFTSVKIFLPFIGIVPLDVAYIMRSTISVKYTVDVLTGACIANITVNRDGAGGVIFTYAGSAIVSYPISSGSYVGVISGALSIAAGIAGTIASGGTALPAVAGAVSGIARAHTDIQHSGQFSGAAGAMGGKKPYLIIERPQIKVASDVEDYEGKPANVTLRIGDCIGFTRIIDAHLSIPNAYDSETAEILQLLKEGVII